MKRLSPALMPLTVALVAPALAQSLGLSGLPAAKPTVQVAADTSAIVPGKPFTVGVTITTPADYHIYWSNSGETGIATSFKWTLPAGYKAEALPFPLPHRFVQAGNITGFGHTGKTTFLFTVTPPADVRAGTTADLSVDASWLCCNKQECVPGSKSVALSLPVAGAATPANADLFAAARAALPADAPPKDLLAMAPPPVPAGDELFAWQLGWITPPASVEIFPPDIAGLDLAVLSADTTPGQPRTGVLMAVNRALGGSTQVQVRAHPLAGQKITATGIPMLVVYTLPNDPARRGFILTIDAAALGVRPGP